MSHLAPEESQRRLAVLQEISLAMTAELDPQRLFDAIAQGARRLLDAPIAATAAWDAGREELVAQAAAGVPLVRHSARLHEMPACVGPAFTQRRTVVLDDLTKANGIQPATELLHAAVAAPLLQDGEALGIIFAGHSDPTRRISPEDVRLLEILASHASLALQNARTLANATRRLAHLEAVGHAMHGIHEARTRDAVVELVLDAAVSVLGGDRAAIFLFSPTDSVLIAAARRLSRPYLDAMTADLRRTAAWRLLHAPTFIAHPENEPRLRALVEAGRREGFRSILFVPIMHRDRPLGLLALYHDLAWAYSSDDLSPIRAFAEHVALALENAALHEQAARQIAHVRLLGAHVRVLTQTTGVAERVRASAMTMCGGGSGGAAWIFSGAGPTLTLEARAGLVSTDDAAVLVARTALAVRHAVAKVVNGQLVVAAPIETGGEVLGALVVSPARAARSPARVGTVLLHFTDEDWPSTLTEVVAAAAGQLAAALAQAHVATPVPARLRAEPE